MFRQSHVVAIALAATALISITSQSARAVDIGARVYTQPWAPQAPDQDLVQTGYDDGRIVSESVKKAWDASKVYLRIGIFSALNGYRVAPGLTLAGSAGNLNDLTDFALSGGAGTATLQFRVPKTVIAIAVEAKALNDADDYTADLASALLTPTFDIGFDIVMSLSLSVSGNSVAATAVHAVVQNATIKPTNDAAKALKGVNDMVSFFGGPDFAKMLEDELNKKDLGSDSLLGAINKGLAPIGQAEQLVAAQTGYSLITMWGDNNRLTLYYAPLPLTNIPTGGVMAGTVRWEQDKFPTANCSTFQVFTDVQTGPRPLMSSDGQNYGPAPMRRVGHFSAHATARTPAGGANACDYVVTGLAANWPHQTSATTSALPADHAASSNPMVGNLHSIGTMQPVGWDGLSVLPNTLAADKDYQLVGGVSAMPALGNPHALRPGQKEESSLVDTVDPVARIQQQTNQAMPGDARQLPARPVQNVPHQPDGGHAADNGPSQAAQPVPPQSSSQSNANAARPTPNQSATGRSEVMPIGETTKAAQTSALAGRASINPQPLPPRTQQLAPTAGSAAANLSGRNMINPQPLPPKQPNGTNGIR